MSFPFLSPKHNDAAQTAAQRSQSHHYYPVDSLQFICGKNCSHLQKATCMYNIETTEAPRLFENHDRVGRQEYFIQMCSSYAFERSNDTIQLRMKSFSQR